MKKNAFVCMYVSRHGTNRVAGVVCDYQLLMARGEKERSTVVLSYTL